MFWSKQYFWYGVSQPYQFNRQPYFTSYRTTQWGTRKAEHLRPDLQQGHTYKSTDSTRMLQEQTAPADGCGHQGSQQTHHKTSQKPPLCNPKLPGKHLWLTRASSTVRIPSSGPAASTIFPLSKEPLQHVPPSAHGAVITGLHTELLKENTAFMPDCFYAK